jgi:hypothetical protein
LKKIIYLFLVLIFAGSGFAQDQKHAKSISSIKEDGQVSPRSFLQPSVLDAPPQFTIPGTDGFWDYMTNGANMQNIAVYGDTIIICYPNTDSIDATGSNSRIAYYLISTNGGISWEAPLPISTSPSRSAYIELQPFVAGGQRQIVLTGRRYNEPNARGGAWKDAFFGLGSFQGSYVPGEGRDFFGVSLGNGIIGGLSSVPFAASNNPADTLYFVKYNASNNTFGTKLKIADPSLNQTGGAIRYRLAADESGNNLLAFWYKDSVNSAGTGFANSKILISTSANGGTSWSSPELIQQARGKNSVLTPGDTCGPWFGIDAAYKPNTSTWGIVWSTLYPLLDNSGLSSGDNQACKILFYSPDINGGKPTIVAGNQNMTILSDTAQFNNRQTLQVGLTPVSHPSIAYSADGSRIYVAFSAFQPGDSLDGFTYNDIWYTYSDNGGLSWVQPKNLTNTPSDDELYPTISMTGNSTTQFHIHYQSTKGPGSQSFNNNAPVYRVYQCYQKVSTVGVNNISTTVPDKFSLKQNYPNPFNPTTSIRFDVTKASRMTLNIYDASGKLVLTLINNEVVPTGTNEVVFDAAKLSSGVYFYTLSSDSFRETKKMMLVK